MLLPKNHTMRILFQTAIQWKLFIRLPECTSQPAETKSATSQKLNKKHNCRLIVICVGWSSNAFTKSVSQSGYRAWSSNVAQSKVPYLATPSRREKINVRQKNMKIFFSIEVKTQIFGIYRTFFFARNLTRLSQI